MNRINDKNFENLRLYIEGKLNQQESRNVEKLLLESRELFNAFMELREALFLKKKGRPATFDIENKIIDIVKNQPIMHINFIIRFMKDKIVVSGGENANLDFNAMIASFSYRSENIPGPVTLERHIAGRDLKIIITPLEENDEFTISVGLKNNEKIEVLLLVDKMEIETIPDISKKKMLRSRIQSNSKSQLIFKKKNKILFTVKLQLESNIKNSIKNKII